MLKTIFGALVRLDDRRPTPFQANSHRLARALWAREEDHAGSSWIRDSGFEFTLAAGEIGPHRTEQNLVDVPLYVEIADAPAPKEGSEMVLSDEHARDKAHLVALEAELANKDKQLGEVIAKLAAVDGALKA
jgi:hypothetical protein